MSSLLVGSISWAHASDLNDRLVPRISRLTPTDRYR